MTTDEAIRAIEDVQQPIWSWGLYRLAERYQACLSPNLDLAPENDAIRIYCDAATPAAALWGALEQIEKVNLAKLKASD